VAFLAFVGTLDDMAERCDCTDYTTRYVRTYGGCVECAPIQRKEWETWAEPWEFVYDLPGYLAIWVADPHFWGHVECQRLDEGLAQEALAEEREQLAQIDWERAALRLSLPEADRELVERIIARRLRRRG
jgi:hypothetical protein